MPELDGSLCLNSKCEHMAGFPATIHCLLPCEDCKEPDPTKCGECKKPDETPKDCPYWLERTIDP